jgi:hypothetical protein
MGANVLARSFMYPWRTKYLKLGTKATISTTISKSSGGNVPKLCIDCRHYLPSMVDPSYGTCAKFVLHDNSNYYVTGKGERTSYHFCSIARAYDDMCGTKGKNFEERQLSS